MKLVHFRVVSVFSIARLCKPWLSSYINFITPLTKQKKPVEDRLMFNRNVTALGEVYTARGKCSALFPRLTLRVHQK